jgi:lysophospholipase L1-like esterase
VIRLNLLRTATLLPHALVRPLALLTTLILAVVLGLLLIKGTRMPERASSQRADPMLEKPGPTPATTKRKILDMWGEIQSEPTPTPGVTEPSQTPSVTLKEVFDYQLKDYKSKLDGLDANVKLQALFIMFTVLLILRRSDSLNLFGNQLPLQWLHLFVPLVILYLWLDFGFLLHGLIYSRIQGIKILETLSPSTVNLGKLLFRDSGFMDGWFLSFVDPSPTGIGAYSGIDHNFGKPTAAFLVIVFGTLISAAHACLIAIAFIGCRRYLRQPSSQFLSLYYVLPLLPIVFLIFSHIQFAYGGSNRNYIQLYIAFMTIPLVAILLWRSVIADREADPGSVHCLRRQRRLVSPDSPDRTTQYVDSLEVSSSVSLIGDSLSTAFYVGSFPGMLSRTWRAWKGTWFVGVADGRSETRSVFERLYEVTPMSAVLHATPRAKVDGGGNRGLLDLVTKTWHLSHQVDEVLIGEFPDLLLLWIGHNNINWSSKDESLSDESCEALSTQFAECYERQLRRLLKGAMINKKPTVIIVYGLINFESFFRARRDAEQRRSADSTQYPYLEKDYEYFAAMKPKHRSGMIQLAESYNKRIESMCGKLGTEIQESDVRLVYSDALSQVEITKADMLHDSDAWHPSPAGHKMLAQSAYDTIKKQLRYLGWVPES